MAISGSVCIFPAQTGVVEMMKPQTELTDRWWIRWCLGIGFWSLVALLFSVQSYLARFASNDESGWTDAFRATLPQWYIWGALSPLIAWTDRRLGLSGKPPLRRLLVHIPVGVGFTFVYIAAKYFVDGVVYGSFSTFNVAYVVGSFQWNILFYWIIAGVYISFDYYRQARERQLRTTELEKNLAQARLHALKAQLHPHFLFNTLNAISGLMEKDPKTARRMIAHLGDLLRFSLDHAQEQLVTLSEELSFLDHYLAIERIRFQDRLSVDFDIEPEVLDAMVPSLLLHPLVENAVRHGITPRAAAGKVVIRVFPEGKTLHIRVSDDGVGLPVGWILQDSTGVGLPNTTERLERMYDDSHTFSVGAAAGGGTLVEIVIPLELEDAVTETTS